MIDPVAGHGTFIAGLVHQACPDAEILSWRIVPPDGPIAETDWVTALAQIAELVRSVPRRRPSRPAHRRAEPFHGLLPRDAGRRAVRLTSTHRPRRSVCERHPRGLLGWQRRHGTTGSPPRLRRGVTGADRSNRARDVLPIVSVGGSNPNGTTDAAFFSNSGALGEGLRTRAGREHVPADLPRWDIRHPSPLSSWAGPGRPSTRTTSRGGSGTWSGTPFAAPLARRPDRRRSSPLKVWPSWVMRSYDIKPHMGSA